MAQTTVANTETDRRLRKQIEQQSDKSLLGDGAEKSGQEGQGHLPRVQLSLSHMSHRKPALGCPDCLPMTRLVCSNNSNHS